MESDGTGLPSGDGEAALNEGGLEERSRPDPSPTGVFAEVLGRISRDLGLPRAVPEVGPEPRCGSIFAGMSKMTEFESRRG